MSWLRRHAVELGVLVLILAAAGISRFSALDRFIASDELRWVCRSINFHRALEEHAWSDTFQVGHPGVITMWLGTLALPLDQVGRWRELARSTEGCTDLTKFDDVGQEGLLQTIAPLLFEARRGVAMGTLVLLALLYLVLRGLVGLGKAPSLFGLAVVAFDPFLLAHSRVLHLDAVTALLCVLAVAALVPVLSSDDPPPIRTLMIAGALAGLAMLEKSSALVLGPFAMAALAWHGWRSVEPAISDPAMSDPAMPRAKAKVGAKARASAIVRATGPWLLGALVVYVALWPAMWVQPITTIVGVLTKAEVEGGVAHEGGNFFLGRPMEDPGPLFYPIVALYRLTPLGVAGLLLAVLTLRRPRREDEDPRNRMLVRWLLVWALCFATVMTIGPKKFDRYLLPALAPINLAVGITLATAYALWRPVGLLHRWIGLLSGGILLAAHVYASQAPYVLDYYNPLFGGIVAAEHVLLLGWGEGYDLAAGFLNQQPNADTLEVTVRGVANFAPLFKGRTRSAEGYRPGTSDYVVVYESQVQRQQNPDLLSVYHDSPELKPVYVGYISGLTLDEQLAGHAGANQPAQLGGRDAFFEPISFVRVYSNATVGAVRAYLGGVGQPGDVLVAGGETVLARHYEGPLRLVRYWGHWQTAEMRESLGKDFPPDWTRAWVVRYPGFDPEVALDELGRVADRGQTKALAGGVAEVTPFTRYRP